MSVRSTVNGGIRSAWQTVHNWITSCHSASIFLVLSVLLVLLFLVQFSLPLVATFDTAHYHTYLPVFDGSKTLADWDPARPPGYPLYLWVVRHVLGASQQAFVLVQGGLLALVVWLVLARIWPKAAGQALGVALLLVLVLLDPLVVGWFHVLLTECLAAVLLVVSCFAAVAWVRAFEAGRPSRLSIASRVLGWTLLIVAGYHIKQSWVFCGLVPAVTAALLVCRRHRTLAVVLTQIAALAVSVSGLAVSIVTWERALPAPEIAYWYDRDSASMLSILLAKGVVPAERLGSISQLAASEGARAQLPRPLRKWVRQQVTARIVDPDCTTLTRVGESAIVAFECRRQVPTIAEALTYVARALSVAPADVLRGYVESLLRISRFRPSGVTIGGGRYDEFSENERVGLRTFSGSNLFPTPDALAAGVAPYSQLQPELARGWLGQLPLLLFGAQVTWRFSVSLAGILLAAGCTAFRFAWQGSRPWPDHMVFLTACSWTAVALVGTHVLLGAVIDRYAFPAYFGSLISWCVCGPAWLQNVVGAGATAAGPAAVSASETPITPDCGVETRS